MSRHNTSSSLQSCRLWLEPDRETPMFKRLCWERVHVPLQDVLLRGIHPVSGQEGNRLLPERVLDAVNGEKARIPALEQFGHSSEISVMLFSRQGWNRPAGLERVLREIGDGLRFVPGGLTYLELLDAARMALRGRWSHSLAREMVVTAFPGFQEMRHYLKAKDGAVKLSGYNDMDSLDLARILSLDDFQEWDSLVVSRAFPVRNFRNETFLDEITDETGLLRLAPEIRHVTLTETAGGPGRTPVVWHVCREGNCWRFRPDLGEHAGAARGAALEFAGRWRTGGGRLCFTSSTEMLVDMVESGAVTPSFPALERGVSGLGPVARVAVESSCVRAFRIGKHPRSNASAERLREVLRDGGAAVSGTKEVLVEKLAALAADKYLERLPEMDGFFRENRFVRMAGIPENTENLALLSDLGPLGNLVLAMYAARHLRGDAVLDVSHVNDTFSDAELALALVTGKTSPKGAFLRAP